LALSRVVAAGFLCKFARPRRADFPRHQIFRDAGIDVQPLGEIFGIVRGTNLRDAFGRIRAARMLGNLPCITRKLV